MSEAGRNADRVVGSAANKFGRAVLLEAMGRIMNRTPVDRGTARANWNVAEGAPDTSTDEGATRSSVSGKKAQNRAAIASIKLFDGDTAYIANGLPYIRRLEDGYSKQAPSGMVKVTIEEIRPWAQGAARRFKRG